MAGSKQVIEAAKPLINNDYNPIFEKLVVEPADGEVLGVIAYGAYKKAKWEWAQAIWEKHGRPPSEVELKAYIATWTPSQLEYVRNNAAQVLSAYADTVIDAAKSDIVTEALKGSFWKNVWTSVFAAGLYTLLLIALAIILHFAGVDVLSVFEQAKPEALQPPISTQNPTG